MRGIVALSGVLGARSWGVSSLAGALRPRVGSARVVVAMNFWGALQKGLSVKKDVDYTNLAGAPASFGKEAAVYALAGEKRALSQDGRAIATFAGGCFWGLELVFQRVPGVVTTSVGYCQGQVEKPSYDEVCQASTGHTEAVQLTYDPAVVSYAELCVIFWDRLGASAVKYHQVGNDRGPQYRAGIYTSTAEQLETARASLVSRQIDFKQPITTEVEAVGIYWPAEEYHQQYLEKGGRGGNGQSAEKGATETIRCYG